MSMNILMIEDEEDRHTAIRDYLEDRRHRVTACWSVAEADKALARIPDRSVAPDAFVSDASGMTCYMKARERFPDMRWILTARQKTLASFTHVGGGQHG